jgi:hypothetical protein
VVKDKPLCMKQIQEKTYKIKRGREEKRNIKKPKGRKNVLTEESCGQLNLDLSNVTSGYAPSNAFE